MKKIILILALFLIIGCVGASPKNSQKKSDINNLEEDNSALEVIEKITYVPSLTGFIIPKGFYLPVKKDKHGTYYQSPEGIRGIGLSFNHWPDGGLLKKNLNDCIDCYDIWYNAPPFGIMRRELKNQDKKIRTIKNKDKLIGKFQTDENGQPHGAYRMINAFGATKALGAFEHGKMSGNWTFWDSNKVKIIYAEYKNGILHGNCRMWYGSFSESGKNAGNEKLFCNFQKGHLEGDRIHFYPEGNKRSLSIFNNDKLIKTSAWDQKGNELSESDATKIISKDLISDKEYLETVQKIITNTIAQ